MNWTTLSSTLLGGLLALGGTTLGQWWNERRALQREERTREHEREIWARQLRHEAHLAFLKMVGTAWSLAVDIRNDPTGPDANEDFLEPIWDKLQELRLISEENTLSKADTTFRHLWVYVYEKGEGKSVSTAIEQYILAVREEFRLPHINFSED
jgi:hypothetical protein